MKRFAVLLLTLALAVCCTLPAFAADTIEVNEDVSVSGDYDWTRFKGQNITLNVYNWGEYISNGSDDSLDVVSAFEDLTGIKVNYTTFDSNESMYAKLKNGGITVDVVIPSDYMIGRMRQEGMLQELNYDNIPNAQYIDDAYRGLSFDPEDKYSVPYTWGTVGIIYNTKYVDEADVTGWELLWNEKYADKILMFDNSRDAFGIAEYLLGYDVNTTDEAELKACADKLAEQKPVVQQYVMDQIFDAMENEEAYIAPYYAGDYLTMVEENEDLAFYRPAHQGYNVFIDAMCIPKGCQNKEGAEAFINFLCRPDISAANLDYIGYSTPETAAKDYLDEEVTSSPVSYPDDETLARSESFAELGVEATQVMNDLWLSVKTSTSNTTLYLILTIAAIAAVILFFVISGIVRRRKKARRCRKWKQA